MTDPRRTALAVLSFNRPDYFRQVAESIARQHPADMKGVDVYVFQDGAVNPFSGERKSPDAPVEECARQARASLPGAVIEASPVNLGIALNYDRAEKRVFEELGYDAAMFFEDDLVPQPHYVGVLRKMLALAAETPRMGLVAAHRYSHAHRTPYGRQEQDRAHVVPMGNNWGFGVLKDRWLRAKPAVDAYLNLVRGKDYSHRPHDAIQKFMVGKGWSPGTTSQDWAKQCAYMEAGYIQVATATNNAKYIGKHGTHGNQQKWDERRYAEAVIYDKDFREIRAPGNPELDRISGEVSWHLFGRPHPTSKAAVTRSWQ